MGLLEKESVLTWELGLNRSLGLVTATLEDEAGRRWGWVVNAASSGWSAHTGDWGQAIEVNMAPPPVNEQHSIHGTLAEAKAWVEEEIAASWKRLCR